MEKQYDDRGITIANEKCMLSDLTERERSIYFKGVGEGLNEAIKIAVFFACVIVLLVFCVVLL